MTGAALIVSHGQPSDPAPAEAELARLAAAVAGLMPGWRVGSATLAAEGALGRAVASLGPEGRVFPLFMAGGWFTRVHLPGRLAAVEGAGWQVLEPLGCDPALHDLTVRVAVQAGAEAVVLAAHGSFKSSVPADIAGHVAGLIRAAGVRVEVGFIDQAPQLETLHGHGPRSVCLPFFAAGGSHVTGDIPAALETAGFQGAILPAIGLHEAVPGLIAAAIRRGQEVCQAACRWQSADKQGAMSKF